MAKTKCSFLLAITVKHMSLRSTSLLNCLGECLKQTEPLRAKHEPYRPVHLHMQFFVTDMMFLFQLDITVFRPLSTRAASTFDASAK